MLRTLVLLLASLALLSAAACSGVEMKRGEQARNNRDIRQGPGMLTGKSGEFVIFRVDDTEVPEEEGAEEGAAQDEVPQGAGDGVTPQ